MMLKGFLESFVYVLAYLAIWAVILFVAIAVIKPAQNDIRFLYFVLSYILSDIYSIYTFFKLRS